MSARYVRAVALAAPFFAGLVASGCNGILGLSRGVLSDGGLAMPCDLTPISNAGPTPCGSGLTCVIGICRPSCNDDSDCASSERCLVEDGSASRVYGCVPTNTTCSPMCVGNGDQFLQTQARTCADGQCRNGCTGNGNYCTSDQTCTLVAGQGQSSAACYGTPPHDTGGMGASSQTTISSSSSASSYSSESSSSSGSSMSGVSTITSTSASTSTSVAANADDAGPPCTTCTLTLEYEAVATGDLVTAISFDVQITNNGMGAQDLTQMTIQYYFNGDGAGGFMYQINDAYIETPNTVPYYQALMTSDVLGTFTSLSPAIAAADTVFTISFSSGTLGADGTLTVDVQFAASNYSTAFTQSNDYSYDGADTTFSPNPDITVELSGATVWGMPP